MICRRTGEVALSAVETEGAVGVRMAVLLGPAEGAPGFVMRRFVVEPGGRTPFHSHGWEHEIYVLSGSGEARHEGGVFPMLPGTVLLAVPGEVHDFVNTGGEPLEFLCVVPRQ